MYNDYPFTIEYKSPIGFDSVTFNNINPSKYGIIYSWTSKNVSVKLYAICYYKDSSSKEIYNDIIIHQNINGELDGNLLEEAFKQADDIGGNGIPVYIEFIITPFKCSPLKWMINVEE